eukprot:scaffold69582_cov58-Phaeocystis_antarctica.AAC.1
MGPAWYNPQCTEKGRRDSLFLKILHIHRRFTLVLRHGPVRFLRFTAATRAPPPPPPPPVPPPPPPVPPPPPPVPPPPPPVPPPPPP